MPQRIRPIAGNMRLRIAAGFRKIGLRKLAKIARPKSKKKDFAIEVDWDRVEEWVDRVTMIWTT